jgi:ectoine hydroxylase-related dioxygenase (phytanoyl-CoA dioxygenase family)
MEAARERLAKDGVVILEDVYTPEQIAEFRAQFDGAWENVKQHLPSFQWMTRHYKNTSGNFFISRFLYHGKRIAHYEDTQVIEMAEGRYDFTHGLEEGVLASDEFLSAPPVVELLTSRMGEGFNGYVGGLPVEKMATEKAPSVGAWHRDADSLFEDESIDVAVPPYYFTMLVPLEDINVGQGTTEFVLGSHKANLSAAGINTREAVIEWADTQQKLDGVMKAGSVCIFDGMMVHRGSANTSSNTRPMLSVPVCVCVCVCVWW